MEDLEFAKIMIGNKRMILCRKRDFMSLKKRKIKKMIRKAFPEIMKEKSWRERLFQRWDYSVEYSREGYSFLFDSKIEWFCANHDWERKPFVALQIKINGRGQYCEDQII